LQATPANPQHYSLDLYHLYDTRQNSKWKSVLPTEANPEIKIATKFIDEYDALLSHGKLFNF
jgi:hypothetical protein